MKLRTLLALIAFLAVAPAAAAQQVDYPHGDTTEPLNCTLCHTQDGWSPAKQPLEFEHDTESGFDRSGRHAELTCESCHLGLDFSEPKISAAGCADCHVDVHLGNLSVECTACHNTTSFSDVPGVGLHIRTSLPLTGTHLQISCESCHLDDTGGAYTTLDPDCFACHAVDYETASLDHVENGFSTDCEACHNTLAFSAGIAFDHVVVSGGFRLLGIHARIACASCHVVPGFESLFPGVTSDQDCIGCHQDDYDTAEPDHVGTGFPTTCIQCHNVERWEDAIFTEHDALYFPIFSGAHRNKWGSCAECHEVPSDFGAFTCLSCHEHERTRMDEKHKEEPGYIYDS
ncbi:MAG: hypothetical protein KAI98_07710, partial [Gemmatimonadetes bacterium]|nr:hypothetical protein [Gemmatimonadota bacterium]